MSEDQLYNVRHSAAHLLAAALLELYPGTKLGTGPVVENGFYYDVLPPSGQTIAVNDFPRIEEMMREIIGGEYDFVPEKISVAQAEDVFTDQPFKLELIQKFTAAGRQLQLYRSGQFVDLCEGGHVRNTRELKSCGFQLTKIAGAYWQADASRTQMIRIYGVLFATEAELKDYLQQLAEAEQRDHRKLGKELELFTIIDEIGPGLPLFYPKGATLRRLVEEFFEQEQSRLGFVNIWVPHIAKSVLYERSGHLGKYDAMFPPMHFDDGDYYLKPMNCPHFMMLYKSQPHSYRDLPLRWTATTTVYRNEKSGELSGLTRVRAVTQDDCHLFMRSDQIEQEFDRLIQLVRRVYAAFGLNDFWVSVSVRDPKDLSKYIGDPKIWSEAEEILQTLAKKNDLEYKVVPGEAAFYGPKLDFMAKDAIGRQWQLSTLQLDFNLPERFDLHYIDADGQKQRPVVVHRAVLGATERWLGVMIEHFAGNFPTWLAPVQVQILTVSEQHLDYAERIAEQLRAQGIRLELNTEAETVGNKIRKAIQFKIPYLIVIGEKEKSADMLAVRKRGQRETVTMSPAEFIQIVQEKNTSHSLEL